MAARVEDLLPVEYFHVVFTLPAEIARIALWNKRAVYGLLFRASADVFDNLLAVVLTCSGFLSHLHSLVVTMCQKPSLIKSP